MIKANQRYILYFDLAMAPHPSDAPPIEMDWIIPLLIKRQAAGKSVQVIDNERRVIRLSDVKLIREKGQPKPGAVALLFSLGDRDKADSGLQHFVTGAVRIPKKEKDEVGGLSVHAVLSLVPTSSGGHLYRMVYEDIPGLGRTLIQAFLRHEFKEICDEQETTFEREDGDPIKTRPLVEITGHASDKLKDSLESGKLLHIELVEYIDQKFGFDENHYIKSAKRNMNLSMEKGLPTGDGLTFVEKVKVWAHQNGYKTMRVRWRDPNLGKAQSAKVDTARLDAGEAFFIRTSELSLKTSLPDLSAAICDELILKMHNLLEA